MLVFAVMLCMECGSIGRDCRYDYRLVNVELTNLFLYSGYFDVSEALVGLAIDNGLIDSSKVKRSK